MARARETSSKKDVRNKKEKKRKDKEQKRLERKEGKKGSSLDDMIAYVDEFGNITDTPPDLSQRTTIDVADIEVGVPKMAELTPEDLIRRGIVTFFDSSKGFGFIKDLSTQQDVFVHVNEILEPIVENNKVTFEVVRGKKGLNAVNVKVDRT